MSRRRTAPPATLSLLAPLVLILACETPATSELYVGDFDAEQGDDLSALKDVKLVTGDLTIRGTNASSLSTLSDLIEVRGGLEITDNKALVTLEHLGNLERVGGHVLISSNPELRDLSGLQALEQIGGGFYITNNGRIENLEGLGHILDHSGDVQISENDNLNSLQGITAFFRIAGQLDISDNPSLSSLEGLEDLYVGSLLMGHNDALRTADIGVSINRDAPATYELDWGCHVYVYEHEALEEIAISGEFFDDCIELSALPALRRFRIGDSAASDIGDLHIRDSPALRSIELPARMRVIRGRLSIRETGLESLEGLTHIQEVQCQVAITDNPELRELGLADLTFSGKDLHIAGNPELPACELTSLLEQLPAPDAEGLSICSGEPEFGPLTTEFENNGDPAGCEL